MLKVVVRLLVCALFSDAHTYSILTNMLDVYALFIDTHNRESCCGCLDCCFCEKMREATVLKHTSMGGSVMDLREGWD